MLYYHVFFSINQGLSCVCEKNSRIVDKVLEFSCKPCPSNLTATSDHLHCLKKTNVSCGLKDIECRFYCLW